MTSFKNRIPSPGAPRNARSPAHAKSTLNEPLKWSRPRRIFVNSMSDLFQDEVPDSFIEAAFEVMRRADWHVYQLLTKRAERMRRMMSRSSFAWVRDCRHIWLGVSVEDRAYGLPRISQLRDTPAAVRFLSIEPLLEELGPIDLRNIHWVIVGGESGPRAREMKEAWVRSVLRSCREQQVRFFFKQWGGVQKKRNGRLLDGELYSEFPDVEPGEGRAPPKFRRQLEVVY